jgi:hypothetical protein
VLRLRTAAAHPDVGYAVDKCSKQGDAVLMLGASAAQHAQYQNGFGNWNCGLTTFDEAVLFTLQPPILLNAQLEMQ